MAGKAHDNPTLNNLKVTIAMEIQMRPLDDKYEVIRSFQLCYAVLKPHTYPYILILLNYCGNGRKCMLAIWH